MVVSLPLHLPLPSSSSARILGRINDKIVVADYFEFDDYSVLFYHDFVCVLQPGYLLVELCMGWRNNLAAVCGVCYSYFHVVVCRVLRIHGLVLLLPPKSFWMSWMIPYRVRGKMGSCGEERVAVEQEIFLCVIYILWTRYIHRQVPSYIINW